jgi:hypothetical protein
MGRLGPQPGARVAFQIAQVREPRGGVVRYPIFQSMRDQHRRTAVSDFRPPQAIAAVRYLNSAAVERSRTPALFLS